MKLVTASGYGVSGVEIYIHQSDAVFDLVGFPVVTDADGFARFTLRESASYSVQVGDLSERYVLAPGSGPHGRYSFNDNFDLVITVGYNPDYNPVVYSLGDNVRDFTVTDVRGNTYTLSELLKTKDMVMINLWYTGCDPCKAEFPIINSVYTKYGDAEILAIDSDSRDTKNSVSSFVNTIGLTIPVCYDRSYFSPTDFGSMYYPTTVIIDRYGTICLIEIGSETSYDVWNNAFAYFTSDNYQQRLFNSLKDIPTAN